MKIENVNETKELKETNKTEEAAPKKRRRKAEPIVIEEKKELTLDEKIENWKKEFGDRIYNTTLFGETYIWRPLTRSEYREIRNTPGEDREIIICIQQVLHPEDKDTFKELLEEKAGIATTLSEEILEKSGFAQFAPTFKL